MSLLTSSSSLLSSCVCLRWSERENAMRRSMECKYRITLTNAVYRHYKAVNE